MAYRAPDYGNIIKLFNNYIQDPKTKVPSLIGFRSYMLTHMSYPSWMVRQLNTQINKDPELKYHINTVIEASMVEYSMLGIYKGDVAKFILKNHHGYQDTPDAQESLGATTKQITFVPAQRPSLEAPHEEGNQST